MISRKNYNLVQHFLYYEENLVGPKTLLVKRGHLNTLLEFIDEVPFADSKSLLEQYKTYLMSDKARRDGKNIPLSLNTVRKNLGTTYEFLT